MSLVLMIFYWVLILVFALLAARGLLRRASTPFHKGFVVAVITAGFLGWFWLVAGERLWFDHHVRQFCAKDGGVRVYETVKLPPEKFNQWGQPNFYRPTEGENALGEEYVLKTNVKYMRIGNPSLRRYHVQIFLRQDDRLLAESVGYDRGGGDLPGPWQPSGFSCPAQHGEIVIDRLFIINKGE